MSDENAVLVTNTAHAVASLRQLYRNRANAENAFDELKNQWGWTRFTTHDLRRCQLSARTVALAYNRWGLFVQLAYPRARRGAHHSHAVRVGCARHVGISGADVSIGAAAEWCKGDCGTVHNTDHVALRVRPSQANAGCCRPAQYMLKEGLRHRVTEVSRINWELLGWSLKPLMTADRLGGAFTMAWFRRRPGPGLGVLRHLDRGSQ